MNVFFTPVVWSIGGRQRWEIDLQWSYWADININGWMGSQWHLSPSIAITKVIFGPNPGHPPNLLQTQPRGPMCILRNINTTILVIFIGAATFATYIMQYHIFLYNIMYEW